MAFSSLKSIGFSLIQLGLHFLDLSFPQTAVLFQTLSIFLLSSQFIGKSCCIYHSLAGLILTKPSLRGHLIQVSMKGLHLSFQLPLGSSNSLVLNGRIRKLFIDVREFLLSNPPVTVSLLKKSPGLLQSILHGMCLPLTSNKGIASYFLGPLFIFKFSLSFPDLLLVFLDVLLGVLVVGIGVFKSNLKLSNIRHKPH